MKSILSILLVAFMFLLSGCGETPEEKEKRISERIFSMTEEEKSIFEVKFNENIQTMEELEAKDKAIDYVDEQMKIKAEKIRQDEEKTLQEKHLASFDEYHKQLYNEFYKKLINDGKSEESAKSKAINEIWELQELTNLHYQKFAADDEKFQNNVAEITRLIAMSGKKPVWFDPQKIKYGAFEYRNYKELYDGYVKYNTEYLKNFSLSDEKDVREDALECVKYARESNYKNIKNELEGQNIEVASKNRKLDNNRNRLAEFESKNIISRNGNSISIRYEHGTLPVNDSHNVTYLAKECYEIIKIYNNAGENISHFNIEVVGYVKNPQTGYKNQEVVCICDVYNQNFKNYNDFYDHCERFWVSNYIDF